MKATTTIPNEIRLGNFTVKPFTGEVESDAGPRHLQPHAAEVLMALAGRPGELCTRKELLTKVWGAGNASDQTLTHCISELRQVLDDDAHDPRVIQTIPRRGYRLIAPVEFVGQTARRDAAPAEQIPTDTDEPDSGSHPGSKRFSLLEELRQRRVFKVATTYAVVAWLITEVSATVLPILGLPEWVVTLVVVSLVVGFPLATALAWAFDISEGGIIRSPGTGSSHTPVGFTLMLLGRTAVMLITLAILIAVLAPESIGGIIGGVTGEDGHGEDPVLLVAPFRPVPSRVRTAGLASRVSGEIARHVASIDGLDVELLPSMSPDVPATSLAAMGQVLMDGTVSELPDRVVVTSRLVETRTGAELWSRSFVARTVSAGAEAVVAAAARSVACGITAGTGGVFSPDG